MTFPVTLDSLGVTLLKKLAATTGTTKDELKGNKAEIQTLLHERLDIDSFDTPPGGWTPDHFELWVHSIAPFFHLSESFTTTLATSLACDPTPTGKNLFLFLSPTRHVRTDTHNVH
jgi:hypothetical protein